MRISYAWIFFLFPFLAFAQSEIELGQNYIVQFSNAESKQEFISSYNFSPDDFQVLSSSLNIFLSKDRNILKFKNHHSIHSIAIDRVIQYRTLPNDALINAQWNLERIGMDEAWNQATGGISPNGDSIVVAVLELGADVEHEDLKNNLWRNQAEIPNDNVDNDNNGYVDDYQGLNIKTGNDQHSVVAHGTAVCGILGASGNNEDGISGINWNVKTLLISQVTLVSEIIESYEYILSLRKAYNDSNGNEGAYIVASNLSAGIEQVFATDFPMWCELYDAMGAEGILSVCAAVNANTNIDELGDMPSTCTSPYLISVTNTNQNDQKSNGAGYGKEHVDIGAPGEGIYSTFPGDSYQLFRGTSASTPHVAGAIALLHSVSACEKYNMLLQSDPEKSAQLQREIILNSGDYFSQLEEQTSTGKRLHIGSAVAWVDTFCNQATEANIQILGLYPNPAVEWLNIEMDGDRGGDIQLRIFNSLGQILYQKSYVFPLVGTALFSIPVADYPQGVYILSALKGKDPVNQAFTIIRQP